MRQLGQVATLKAASNVLLLSLVADPRTRFERTLNNEKLGEAATLDEFISREQAEKRPLNAQCLFECMALADCSITNDGTVEELYTKLDTLVSL